MRFLSLVAIVGALLASSVALAQAPAVIDRTPFERPKPLCSITGEEVKPALQVVFETLKKLSYSVTQADFQRGELRATQTDGKAENRVIVWLEWDLLNHGKQLNLYFSPARFEPFLGFTDLQRVPLPSNQEQKHFAKIKDALIAAALSKG